VSARPVKLSKSVAKCARYVCPILNKIGASYRFSPKSPISNITEIRPLGAMLIRADRRTDEHPDGDAL